MAEPNQFQNLNIQHESDETKRLRVGVKNWVAELGRKVDGLDQASLDWLNKAFANISSGLYALQQRKTAAAGPQLARDIPLSPMSLAEMLIKDMLEKLASLEWHVERVEGVDPSLVASVSDARKALEGALEKTKNSLEQSKVAEMLEGLRKGADILDASGGEAAMQVAEGIDAVLETGASSQVELLEKLAKVADLFDAEGKTAAADAFEVIIRQAVELPKIPGRWESRKDKYDVDAHRSETMWDLVKHEVAENRKEHHLETHRGTPKSLSTRYSPELPGVPLMHVSDGVYQDFLTKKIYDFNKGFTLQNGEKVPGGSVKHQTPNYGQTGGSARMFETRQNRRANTVVPMAKVATHDFDNKPTIVDCAISLVKAGLPPDQVKDYLGLCPLQYDEDKGWVIEALDPVKAEDGWLRVEPNSWQSWQKKAMKRQAIKDDGLSGSMSKDELVAPGPAEDFSGPFNRVEKSAPAKYTPDQIKKMREWIAQCEWGDDALYDSENFAEELSDAEVIQGVKRHYDGGIDQFLKDATPQTQVLEKQTG